MTMTLTIHFTDGTCIEGLVNTDNLISLHNDLMQVNPHHSVILVKMDDVNRCIVLDNVLFLEVK